MVRVVQSLLLGIVLALGLGGVNHVAGHEEFGGVFAGKGAHQRHRGRRAVEAEGDAGGAELARIVILDNRLSIEPVQAVKDWDIVLGSRWIRDLIGKRTAARGQPVPKGGVTKGGVTKPVFLYPWVLF